MKIVKIISEWKNYKKRGPADIAPKKGFKRVEAVVDLDSKLVTRHIDIPKEETIL